MSLVEHAIRTTFSTLDDETKKRLIDEFRIDCYGITVNTISCIKEQNLRRFAYFVIRDDSIIEKMKTLGDLKIFFNKYRNLKDNCVGGYFFSHYFSNGDNTYIYTKDTTFEHNSERKSKNEFIINTDPEEIDRKFVGKEEFFHEIEQKNIRKTLIALQNFKLYYPQDKPGTYITLSSYLLS